VAHIELGNDLPGIQGLLAYRPETGRVLGELAEVLLRGDNSLTRGERELIAARVSGLNRCRFCHDSHGAFAAAQVPGGWDVVEAVDADPSSAPVGEKMAALLAIADRVQEGGGCVSEEDVAAARDAGATDTEIHDTVLIAAAFCMYNRYVDGLGTWAPSERAAYDAMAPIVLEQGYDRDRSGAAGT
jgi:uncharacterized peroxidase-related enzyme